VASNPFCALLAGGSLLPRPGHYLPDPMEEVEWTVEGSQFECRLTQPVSGYGRRCLSGGRGERPVFQLEAVSNLMQPGQAQLYNEPPPGGTNALDLARPGLD